jgi:hypothetical protein
MFLFNWLCGSYVYFTGHSKFEMCSLDKLNRVNIIIYTKRTLKVNLLLY